jgi:hypothetical protein
MFMLLSIDKRAFDCDLGYVVLDEQCGKSALSTLRLALLREDRLTDHWLGKLVA